MMFENDVNMYGTQAIISHLSDDGVFENDVNMYGTQALVPHQSQRLSLRMM